MKEQENMEKMKAGASNEMINSVFNFWYNDHEKIRSPFPEYIREETRIKTLDKFFDWMDQFADSLKTDENEKLLAERLEQLLFETGIELVKSDDEKMTLFYPFLPRIGDQVVKKDSADGKNYVVMKRKFIKNGDEKFMKITAQNIATGENWETSFELPS